MEETNGGVMRSLLPWAKPLPLAAEAAPPTGGGRLGGSSDGALAERLKGAALVSFQVTMLVVVVVMLLLVLLLVLLPLLTLQRAPQGGMQTLSDALAEELQGAEGVTLRLEAPCVGLAFDGSGATVTLDGGEELRADHVFGALPAPALAKLLPSIDGGSGAAADAGEGAGAGAGGRAGGQGLRALLERIPYASLSLVHLGWEQEVLRGGGGYESSSGGSGGGGGCGGGGGESSPWGFGHLVRPTDPCCQLLISDPCC